MNTELQKAIFNHMVGNKDFQLINNTVDKFKQYIYTLGGHYCLGGKEVADFIKDVDILLNSNK
jgi:hypothetical protein